MFLLRLVVALAFVAGFVFLFNRYIRPAFPSRAGISDAERALAEAEAKLEAAHLQRKVKELNAEADKHV